VAEKKETREFDGRTYLMERALKADFAFIKAWKGDKLGQPCLSQNSHEISIP